MGSKSWWSYSKELLVTDFPLQMVISQVKGRVVPDHHLRELSLQQRRGWIAWGNVTQRTSILSPRCRRQMMKTGWCKSVAVGMERRERNDSRSVKGGGCFIWCPTKNTNFAKYCLARCACVCVCDTLVSLFHSASSLLWGPYIGQQSQKAADRRAWETACYESQEIYLRANRNNWAPINITGRIVPYWVI